MKRPEKRTVTFSGHVDNENILGTPIVLPSSYDADQISITITDGMMYSVKGGAGIGVTSACYINACFSGITSTDAIRTTTYVNGVQQGPNNVSTSLVANTQSVLCFHVPNVNVGDVVTVKFYQSVAGLARLFAYRWTVVPCEVFSVTSRKGTKILFSASVVDTTAYNTTQVGRTLQTYTSTTLARYFRRSTEMLGGNENDFADTTSSGSYPLYLNGQLFSRNHSVKYLISCSQSQVGFRGGNYEPASYIYALRQYYVNQVIVKFVRA